MIRKNIKEIVKNIDKFEQNKGHSNLYNYKNIEIYVGSVFASLTINEKEILLSNEEDKYLFNAFKEKHNKNGENELNSISFNEEGEWWRLLKK